MFRLSNEWPHRCTSECMDERPYQPRSVIHLQHHRLRNLSLSSTLRYAEFYCYTDASYWEPCCGQPDSCQSGEAKSESYCATTDAGGGKKARCRPNALAVTLSGRRCARDSFCGYYNQKYGASNRQSSQSANLCLS